MARKKALRAAGYVRLSKESADTTSPARQREGIRTLCSGRGWELVETFEDIDVSAFTGAHRPGFDRMMARLGEIDVIVFWRLDRLARSLSQLLKIAEVCEAAGVQLVSTDGEVDTVSAAGRAFYQMRGVFAELESRTLSERSKAMHDHKRKNDEPVGRAPYGWSRVGKRHEPDKQQQAILREAAERFVTGETFNAIATDLSPRYVASLPKRDGKAETDRLHTAALSRMLHSERVIEALPERLSGLLVEALKDRRWERTPTSSRSLLGGIARCGECGSSMTVTATRGGRANGRWFSYGCRTSGHVAISARWLEEHVCTAVLERVDTGLLLKEIRRRAKVGTPRKVSELEARLEILEDDFYSRGKLTQARFDRQRDRLLDALQQARETERRDADVDVPAELARNLTAQWPTLEVPTRRRVIRAVLDRVEVSKATDHGPVDPDRAKLVWR